MPDLIYFFFQQGEIHFPGHELRDPYIFYNELTKNNYLLCFAAGEKAVGIVIIKKKLN